ncbi:multidrug resistance protein MdtN [Botrimarina colliarenosi]|uniref:Multidrug resistance protein MdtN n=1 Tax=Botrimarina colliarenosi TaxID=2528001 RepID=A0A5C6AAQ9_9BACT|nr:efflux RND transporter periplasmic adaptor subunit [Botrimarina colliarenosi]TWT96131.1 multidrug resistance protein MdtN [Botrimarina colliarenosi]
MKRSRQSVVAGSEAWRACAATLALALCLSSASLEAAEVSVASSILTVSETVKVPAPEAGVLRELSIHEGARVRRGDRIGEVDAREQQLTAEVIEQDLLLAQRESESDVRVRLAEKENKVAEAELIRATSINAELPNTVSIKEVDRLRLAMERTELEIEFARFERDLLGAKLKRIEADLRLAQHRVERMSVTAPIAGVVAEVYRHSGEWVDAGEPLARLVRVDRLRAEGYVGIDDALLGLVNRPVTVEADLPSGETLRATGRVVFVSPEAEPVDSKVRFWAEIDNRAMRLRPGLTARVVILDAPIESDALSVK